MAEALRVGIVGAGMVARYHVAAWARTAGVRLLGIADPDVVRAMERASLVPEADVFASFAEMRAALSLDAVDIVAPPQTHAALLAEAQSAGLHAICQKPLAPSAREAAALIASLTGRTRVMVHENYRWRYPYRQLKMALASGELSPPASFEFRVESAGLLPDAGGRFPALKRQPFMAWMPRLLVLELLVHHLDTLMYLFGDIRILSAHLSRRCPAVIGEDRAEIQLTVGGIPGWLIADFCTPASPPLPRDRLWFAGVDNPLVDGWALSLPSGGRREWEGDEAYQNSYTATTNHFVDALMTGKPFETPPEVALRVLKCVEEIYAVAQWKSH